MITKFSGKCKWANSRSFPPNKKDASPLNWFAPSWTIFKFDEHSYLGVGQESLLSDSRRHERFENEPSLAGIGPQSWLPFNIGPLRSGSCPKEPEIGPYGES